jgi:hypothetical protein
MEAILLFSVAIIGIVLILAVGLFGFVMMLDYYSKPHTPQP